MSTLDQKSYLQCLKIYQKLEARPMYQYLLKSSNTTIKNKLDNVKHQFINQQYSSSEILEENISSILDYSWNLSQDEKEQLGIYVLSQWLKKKFSAIKTYTEESFVQKLVKKLNKLIHVYGLIPPDISQYASHLKTADDVLTCKLSVKDISMLKKGLTSLIPKDKLGIAFNLIRALEPSVFVTDDEIVFDLNDFQPETLIALREFTKRNIDYSKESILL